MSIRRLSMLQWVGLLAGLVVWIGQHIVGWGITEAECGAGSGAFGIENDNVGLAAGQFTHDCVRSLSPGDLQFNDTVIPDLTNIVDPRSLEMGSEKLTERWRCRRIDW